MLSNMFAIYYGMKNSKAISPICLCQISSIIYKKNKVCSYQPSYDPTPPLRSLGHCRKRSLATFWAPNTSLPCSQTNTAPPQPTQPPPPSANKHTTYLSSGAHRIVWPSVCVCLCICVLLRAASDSDSDSSRSVVVSVSTFANTKQLWREFVSWSPSVLPQRHAIVCVTVYTHSTLPW